VLISLVKWKSKIILSYSDLTGSFAFLKMDLLVQNIIYINNAYLIVKDIKDEFDKIMIV